MSPEVLIVVACGAAKHDRPAPAADLYTSTHFQFILAAARSEATETRRVCGQTVDVAIFSALHGLLDLDQVIAPYDVKMGDPSAITVTPLAAQLAVRQPREVISLLPAAYRRILGAAIEMDNAAAITDITLTDAFENAPGIGYHRAVAASLLRTTGRLPDHPQHRQRGDNQ